MNCKYCGSPMQGDVCPACGAMQIEKELKVTKVCPFCGSEYDASEGVCPYCGEASQTRSQGARRTVRRKRQKRSGIIGLPIFLLIATSMFVGAFSAIIGDDDDIYRGIDVTVDEVEIYDDHFNNATTSSRYYSYVDGNQLYLTTGKGIISYDIDSISKDSYTEVVDGYCYNPYVEDGKVYYSDYKNVMYNKLDDDSDISYAVISGDNTHFEAKIYKDHILYISGNSEGYTLYDYQDQSHVRKVTAACENGYFLDENTGTIYTLDRDYKVHKINIDTLEDRIIASSVYNITMYHDQLYFHDGNGVYKYGEKAPNTGYTYYSSFVIYQGRPVAVSDGVLGYVDEDGELQPIMKGNVRDVEVQGDLLIARLYDKDYHEFFVAIDKNGESTIIYSE